MKRGARKSAHPPLSRFSVRAVGHHQQRAVAGALAYELDGEIVIVPENEVPMAEMAEIKTWALINLIAAIITVLTALIMAISYFRKNDEEDENEDDEEEKNERNGWKFLGMVPAVLSVIIFILTENMRYVMTLTDRFTILMIVITLVTFLIAFLTRNRKEDDDEEETEYVAAIC